ncbi:MAG: hypothetical protein ACRDFZ_04330 [Candidatus Limnocylindria bacterium]
MALVRDLITASRIESLVVGGGGSLDRVLAPDQLPPADNVDLVVVDWAEREADWGATIAAWRDGAANGRRPRIVLFGPHTDLVAHAAARHTGLGPMRARSAFFASLPDLMNAYEG